MPENSPAAFQGDLGIKRGLMEDLAVIRVKCNTRMNYLRLNYKLPFAKAWQYH